MATPLLDPDGTASMATAIMCSHHAFHRDVACLATVLDDESRSAIASEAWTFLRNALHGHHTSEETGVFPDLLAKHPELAPKIAALDTHHRAIDPLLERGDAAFADLANRRADARDVVAALRGLLVEHLAAEELVIVSHLRTAKQFPAPPNDEAVAMYAQGFAWALGGIAEQVVTAMHAILPPALVDKLPAARAAYAEHSRRVWGHAPRGASVTSVPATY